MKKKSPFITDTWFLKLKFRIPKPKELNHIQLKLLNSMVSQIIKILGPMLGFGRVQNNVVRLKECMVTLKDGTRLATDIYLPKNVFKKKGKCPTILIRLPYWKDGYFSVFGHAFASYGYALVIQDSRGCAHSEGFNFFLQTERQDGLDTLEWITKHFWYNGKIGMAGGSYFGMTQNVLSWDNKYLTCIAPAICCFSNLWRYHGGLNIHELSTAIYQIMLSIVIFREKPPVDLYTQEMQNLWLNPRYALYNPPIQKKGKYLKFSDFIGKTVEECVEILADFYKIEKWSLTKRNYKIYFKFLEDFLKLEKDIERMPGLFELDFSKFSQPAFFQAGWQDMFLEHILRDFLELKAKAPPEVNKYLKLAIGPWGHADKGHPQGNMIEFIKDFMKKDWYDYWLKGDKSAFKEINTPSIRYYVMGRKLWRYLETWPPKNVEYKNFYLHSKGRANSKKGDGALSFDQPLEESEDKYIFDPLHPVITRGGQNLAILKGAHDQKKAEKRKDVLIYTSEPFENGIEITGPIKVVLYASSSAKDTDFTVKLVDVYPRGKAINILDTGIRARFRNGETKPPSFIEPGKVIKYEFELGNTSNYFRPGHCIRVEISSSNFPRFDINANMGGEGKPGDYATAEQKIYHNQENPTHLIIPVFK